jgi:flagellar protein FlgJ
MESYSLGAAYFNDYRFDPSITAASAGRNPAGDIQDFATILEKAASAHDENNVVSGPSGSKTEIDKNDKLYQLCLELETFLVKNLLNSMRNTVQKSGLIDEGFAGKMYEDMLYDEYAKDFTKNANFGLAEQAYLQLKQQQG